MEYVASKLGIVFMKVNGPALGSDVHSLDPNEAPNATARHPTRRSVPVGRSTPTPSP